MLFYFFHSQPIPFQPIDVTTITGLEILFHLDSNLVCNYIANSPGRAHIVSSVSNLSLSKNDKGDKDIGYLGAVCMCVYVCMHVF